MSSPSREADYDEPSPTSQRDIIEKNQHSDSLYQYTVSRAWYKQWKHFVGILNRDNEDPESESKGAKSSKSTERHVRNSQTLDYFKSPGPLIMDNANEDDNILVNEKVWLRLVSWYGVHETHQLNRRRWGGNEKTFEVCILNPYSGIVSNPSKTFDVSEETGYVELQLRKIFKVPKSKSTRLWACEKSRNARFGLLLDRTKELCFQDDLDPTKDYILALEISNHDNSWPTCIPGETQGSFEKFKSLTEGPTSKEFWEMELANTVSTVFNGITCELKETINGVIETTKCINEHKEKDLCQKKEKLESQLKQTVLLQKSLEERNHEVVKQEEVIKGEAKRLRKDRESLDTEKDRLAKEMLQMEELNQMTETRVRLDVGGHIYTTSVLTLTKDAKSMLAAMFSGRHSISKEADGTYFIDRDGTHFRYVLNYLRDGGFRAGTLPLDSTVLSEILAEAEYYQLEGLAQLLRQQLKDSRDLEGRDPVTSDYAVPEKLGPVGKPIIHKVFAKK